MVLRNMQGYNRLTPTGIMKMRMRMKMKMRIKLVGKKFLSVFIMKRMAASAWSDYVKRTGRENRLNFSEEREIPHDPAIEEIIDIFLNADTKHGYYYY